MRAAPQRFSALYYPYSRCLREVDLKRMLLIFDEILFVDPLSKDLAQWPGQYPIPNQAMHIRIMQDSNRLSNGYYPVLQRGIAEPEYPLWNWYQIQDTYKYLEREGVIRLIDPVPLIRKHDSLLSYALAYDLLVGTSTEAGMTPFFLDRDERHNPKWILHRDRIPRFLHDLSEDERFWSDAAIVLSTNARGFTPEGGRFLIRQAIESIRSGEDQVSVHYDLAYSLILSQALLLADEFTAFPVTDNGLVHQGLVKKCERLYANTDSRAVIYSKTPSHRYREAVIGLNAVSHAVPDAALSALTIEQVVEYRRTNHVLLESMWSRLRELASQCDADMSSGDFPNQVLLAIDSKLSPELEHLDRQLVESHRRLFGVSASKLIASAAKAAAPAVPTVSLAALFGLSLGQIVGLGVSGLLVGVGIALPDVIEGLMARRELSRSGLAYLLNIPNERH